MKTLYIECNMGASGDMLMGALYEICEQKELFLDTMNDVFADFDIQISAEPSEKRGIHGTKMHVRIHDTEEGDIPQKQNTSHTLADALSHAHTQNHEHTHDKDTSHGHVHAHDKDTSHSHTHTHGKKHSHASYSSILEKIDSLELPGEVKRNASAIYKLIGEAEAKVHQTNLEQIHFHEVGSLDAIADVCGCALLFYLIEADNIYCSPIHVGNGFVKCAHGVLPVPAPATAELLKGIPHYTGSITSELLTPTGATILKYYVKKFCSMPVIATDAIGYGMGTKDFHIANCLRIFSGESFEADSFPSDDSILGISCNLDDMTGEAIGLATEILIAAGALDVFVTPIQMKKNRPGILLTCLCNIYDREKFTGLLFLHTTTRGVRYQTYQRAKLASTFESRKSPYGNVRVKKSSGYGVEKEKAEFEDLKTLVLKHGCSIEEIQRNLD